MVQSEATPPIVAEGCDPGVSRTAGLTEASHSECYPKTAVFEPFRIWALNDHVDVVSHMSDGVFRSYRNDSPLLNDFNLDSKDLHA